MGKGVREGVGRGDRIPGFFVWIRVKRLGWVEGILMACLWLSWAGREVSRRSYSLDMTAERPCQRGQLSFFAGCFMIWRDLLLAGSNDKNNVRKDRSSTSCDP